MKTRVYILAPFDDVAAAQALAERLTAAGVDVISAWHKIDDPTMPADDHVRAVFMAASCIQIHAAHIIVADLRCGRNAYVSSAIGYALGIDRPVIWLHGVQFSDKSNVFYHHPLVASTSSVDEAIELLCTVDRELAIPEITQPMAKGAAS